MSRCVFVPCSEEINKHPHHYRCENPNCEGKMPDEKFAKLHGLRTEIKGFIFTIKKQQEENTLADWIKGVFKFETDTAITCPNCGRDEFIVQVCWNCHSTLSTGGNGRTIAVLGGTTAGKTCYLTSLIEHFQSGQYAYTFTGSFVDEYSQNRWLDQMYNFIFVDNEIPPPTLPGDPEIQMPIAYQFLKDDDFVSLNLYDVSGDDMLKYYHMIAQIPQIAYAQGFIFLIDPFQLLKVRNQLHLSRTDTPPFIDKARPQSILEFVLSSLRQRKKLARGEKFNKPVNFVISKIDRLKPLFQGKTYTFLQSSKYDGEFDPTTADIVSQEVEDLLMEWEPGLVRYIQNNFYKYHFSAISALGSDPDPVTQRIPLLKPHRVEDPLLWLLHQFEFI